MFNVDTINNINSPPPLTSLKISKDDLSEKVHIFENNNLSIEESTNKTATSFFSDTFNKNANISYLNISIGNRIEIKFTNLFNKIKSVVFLYLVLNPAINKHISEQLAKIDPKHYHMNYQKFALSSSKLFKTLQEKHSFPSAYSNLFLRSHFENKLINQIERELKKNKLPSISKEEIQKAHHECSLNYLIKETSTFMDLKNQISIIPSNQMPIDLLKEIELNDENKDFLLSTWKRIVEDLPKKGDLDKLESPYLRSSASLRIECAIKLLEVLKFAPKSVDAKLDEEIAKYSDEAYKLALVNFIVHESSVTNRPINTKYSNLVEKQNAYRTIVKKLEVELKKDFNEIENLTEVKVRKLVNKLYCSISKTQQHLFSKNDLRQNLIKEVETYAFNTRGFTPLQIEKLKKEREKNKEVEKSRVFLFKAMEEIEILNQKYQQFAEERFHGDEIRLSKGLDIFQKVAGDDLYRKLNSNFPDIRVLFECFYEIKTKKYDFHTNLVIGQAYHRIVNDYIKDKANLINLVSDYDVLLNEVRSIALIRDKLQTMEIPENIKKEISENLSCFNDQISNPLAIKLLSYPFENLNTILRSQIIFGNDIEKDIKSSSYNHPSKIPTEVLTLLLKISKIDFLIENNCPIEEFQKQDLINSLQNSLKIPGLLGYMEKFINKDNDKGDKGQEVDEGSDVFGHFLSRVMQKIKPSQMQEYYQLPLGISEEARDLLYNLIKVQQKLPDLLIQLSKGKKLLKNYKLNPRKIKSSERLNLHELGVIFKLAEYKEELEFYEKLGLEKDPLIKEFASAIRFALKIKNGIEEILLPAFGRHYSSGDIFAYYGKRKEKWGAVLQKCDKGAEIFCDGKTHGMKAYRNGQELRGSEIAKDYDNTQMRVYDVAISDIWRLKIKSLISKTSELKLKEIFGNNWSQILQEKYEEIEKDIHGKKSVNYSGIENNSLRRIRAGMADWKLLLEIATPFLPFRVRGHTKKYDQDFNKIYDIYMNGRQVKEEQICSEFVSKTTLVAIMELNKFVAKAIAEKYPNLINSKVFENLRLKGAVLPKHVEEYLNGIRKFGKERIKTVKAERDLRKILKKYDYDSKEIDLIFRLNNNEIIDLPYDKRERMNKIHPGRMVTVLNKKKCIVKLKKPKEFDALINTD